MSRQKALRLYDTIDILTEKEDWPAVDELLKEYAEIEGFYSKKIAILSMTFEHQDWLKNRKLIVQDLRLRNPDYLFGLVE